MQVLLNNLTQELQAILPDATLQTVLLPECSTLQLYLIDPKYSIAGLDTGTAQQVMDNPLYWLFCWASGRVMAQQILAEPKRVKNKVIMDVGSGSGVVAIAAALAGAKKVIASDIDPMAQKAIALNAQLNNVQLEIIGDYAEYTAYVDMITIADVLYDRNNMPLLEVLVQRAPEVYLADSRVKNFAHPGFKKTGRADGETFPDLGGFDEFSEVNIYSSLF
jgi:predicted nicotinamide N-methyase